MSSGFVMVYDTFSFLIVGGFLLDHVFSLHHLIPIPPFVP